METEEASLRVMNCVTFHISRMQNQANDTFRPIHEWLGLREACPKMKNND